VTPLVRFVRRLAVLLALSAGATASANVLEIDKAGTVHVRSGAGAVTWTATADPTDVEPAPEVPAQALTVLTPAMAPVAYQATLVSVAEQVGLSPQLLAALVWRESGWRANARSLKGAFGLAQLMPNTARALAVDPRDPVANLSGGARYLRAQLDRFGGDVEKALAAYNAGPDRVARARGVPAIAETQAYVAAILGRINRDLPVLHGDKR
jgi:hypothetical protein